MLRVGLTGGIGCGKSTVGAMMRELGCHILDADELAHRVIEPGGTTYDDVVREFGRDILDASGRVDHRQTRRYRFRRFRSPRASQGKPSPIRASLKRAHLKLSELEQRDPRGVAVIEAALLIEAGYYKQLDRLIVALDAAPNSS